ncbi:MAG: GntR family transcriptional regulator [Acutalibacteraceae bacterium]|jgi:hypothetical protein|nr:GntR family transcriptional regulator [Acutalibacteraceae bacterium]
MMFTLNFQSREPIYEQLYNNVVRLASLGVLQPEEQLPPVRSLATQLGVNPNTVSKAYQLLERDGIIYSAVGRGSFVSSGVTAASLQRATALDELTKAIRKACDIGITKEELKRVIDDTFAQKEGQK